jgi:hypothetical protein
LTAAAHDRADDRGQEHAQDLPVGHRVHRGRVVQDSPEGRYVAAADQPADDGADRHCGEDRQRPVALHLSRLLGWRRDVVVAGRVPDLLAVRCWTPIDHLAVCGL